MIIIFQSTSPVRGTTYEEQIAQFFGVQFQSTSPVRGTTRSDSGGARRVAISIHVPREGDDDRHSDFSKSFTISIHVPREGDDCDGPGVACKTGHFNPRPP